MNPQCHYNISLQSNRLDPLLQVHHSSFGVNSQQILTDTLGPVTAKLIPTALLHGLETQT